MFGCSYMFITCSWLFITCSCINTSFDPKGAFVLGENDFRKSFSPKSACLAVTENDIFRKMTSGWRIFSPLTRKWFCTLIFPSNHFQKKREREREKREPRSERERGESPDRAARPTIAPRRQAARSTRSRGTIDEIAQCDRGSSGAIDERARWTRTARRSMSSAIAIFDRAACQTITPHWQATRSTMAPLVAHRTARRSSHRDRTARRSSLIHFLLLGFGFFCLIWCIFCKNVWMNQTPKLIFCKTSFVTAKHMKTFSFPENSISGKWNIFRKCFYANQT